MSYSPKLYWTVRHVAVSVLLSFALHGLLFSALCFWPVRPHGPALTIESTRITLDTCNLDSSPPLLLPERELPAELLNPEGNHSFAPQLVEVPPAPSKLSAPPGLQTSASRLPGPRVDTSRCGHSLFPLPATAASVVYVLDRSVSMGLARKLDFARRELIASLRHLPATMRFQVIAYNHYADTLVVDGRRDLLPAEQAIVDKAVLFLEALEAAGATNHLAALRRGLELHPDVLYFLTDADDLKPEVLSAVAQQNQHTVIHTIELSRFYAPSPEGPLAQLARNNGGTYRRVAVGD